MSGSGENHGIRAILGLQRILKLTEFRDSYWRARILETGSFVDSRLPFGVDMIRKLLLQSGLDLLMHFRRLHLTSFEK